jgi:hypothetical protein
MAGILPPQVDRIAAAYQPWLTVTVIGERDGWVLMGGIRSTS